MKKQTINSRLVDAEIYDFVREKNDKMIELRDFDDRVSAKELDALKHFFDFKVDNTRLWDMLTPKHSELTRYKANVLAITDCYAQMLEKKEKVERYLDTLKTIANADCYSLKRGSIKTEISKEFYYNAELLYSLYNRLAFIENSQEKQVIKHKIQHVKNELKKSLAVISILAKSKNHVLKNGDKELSIDVNALFDDSIYDTLNDLRKDINTLGWFLKNSEIFVKGGNISENIKNFLYKFEYAKDNYHEVVVGMTDASVMTPLQAFAFDALSFPTKNKNFLTYYDKQVEAHNQYKDYQNLEDIM